MCVQSRSDELLPVPLPFVSNASFARRCCFARLSPKPGADLTDPQPHPRKTMNENMIAGELTTAQGEKYIALSDLGKHDPRTSVLFDDEPAWDVPVAAADPGDFLAKDSKVRTEPRSEATILPHNSSFVTRFARHRRFTTSDPGTSVRIIAAANTLPFLALRYARLYRFFRRSWGTRFHACTWVCLGPTLRITFQPTRLRAEVPLSWPSARALLTKSSTSTKASRLNTTWTRSGE